MLNSSSLWLSQDSFDTLYPFRQIEKSPLINYLLYDRAQFTDIPLEDVDRLLNNKISSNDKLIISATYGLLKIVKYLVDNGADIHAKDDLVLQVAIENGHLEIVQYLVSKGVNIHVYYDLALQWAARNGHLDIVKYLVDQGANIHAIDDWALREAEENGHDEVVAYLKSLP